MIIFLLCCNLFFGNLSFGHSNFLRSSNCLQGKKVAACRCDHIFCPAPFFSSWGRPTPNKTSSDKQWVCQPFFRLLASYYFILIFCFFPLIFHSFPFTSFNLHSFPFHFLLISLPSHITFNSFSYRFHFLLFPFYFSPFISLLFFLFFAFFYNIWDLDAIGLD